MHTGDRTKELSSAGGVLPGYAGIIVRDGYKGYEHLPGALHAWCGAHGLRDLAGLSHFDPRRGRSGPLRHGRPAHRRQRRCHRRPRQRARLLDEAQLKASIPVRRGVAKGITRRPGADRRDRQGRAAAGPPVPRREDMILRFTTDLAVGFTSNQARGTGRTPRQGADADLRRLRRALQGLANFAIVPVCLSTARRMGHRRARRPRPAIHRPALAPPRNCAPPVNHQRGRTTPAPAIRPRTRRMTDGPSPNARATLPACRRSAE